MGRRRYKDSQAGKRHRKKRKSRRIERKKRITGNKQFPPLLLILRRPSLRHLKQLLPLRLPFLPSLMLTVLRLLLLQKRKSSLKHFFHRLSNSSLSLSPTLLIFPCDTQKNLFPADASEGRIRWCLSLLSEARAIAALSCAFPPRWLSSK